MLAEYISNHISVEMNSIPKMRRIDAIELPSILCMITVSATAEMKTEAKAATVVCRGSTPTVDNNPNRITLDTASSIDKERKEGSLNRCLYLRDRFSVE